MYPEFPITLNLCNVQLFLKRVIDIIDIIYYIIVRYFCTVLYNYTQLVKVTHGLFKVKQI